jgi:lupus La protein
MLQLTELLQGSVFVEFDTQSTAESFLSSEPKPQWEGADLLLYSKQAYCDMKIKEKGLTGAKATKRRSAIAGESSSSAKTFNAFREMREKRDKKPDGAKGEGKDREIYLEFMGKKIRVYEEEDGATIKEDEWETVPNATLKFEGCNGDCLYSEVKVRLRLLFCHSIHLSSIIGSSP